MNGQKKSRKIQAFTAILTLCIFFGTSFLGIYPASAAFAETGKSSVPKLEKDNESTSYLKAEAKRYYNAGSLLLFQAVFPRLDKQTQKAWLKKFYNKDEIAFFNVSVQQLDAESPLVKSFAKKAYQDDGIAFFSVLTQKLSKATLKMYLDNALSDGRVSFQAMLYDQLGYSEELEQQKEALEQARIKEYKAYGITKEGRDYYYKGKLIHIFLDYQAPSSVCTLDLNPQGTENIKIIRRKNGKIKEVSYLSEHERKEWFRCLDDPDTPS